MVQLIPVIDLKGGHVVQARRGERASYRPIASPLAESSAPQDVVAGLLSLAPFSTLYVADLDSIAGHQTHHREIRGLREAFPAVALWVDAGESSPEAVAARAAADLGTSVIGTESLASAAQARAVLADPRAILSLDHDARGPLGPQAVHEQAELWPERVIVMTLARVGAGEGPDFERLAAVRARRASGAVFAAGGVRGAGDLARLAELGVAGVLVASALHDGRIDRATARAHAGASR